MRVQHVAERWITAVEAATRLGIGMDHLYKLLMVGKLTGEKQGKRWRVSAQAVEQRRERLKLTQGSKS